MGLPTARDIFSYQYTLVAHVALLLLLFAVCLAPVMIVFVNNNKIDFVVGIILPPVASLFVCVRVFIRQLDTFCIVVICSTLILEIMAYVFHLLMITVSLGVGTFNVWSLNEMLIIAGLLEVMLVYKVMPGLVCMMCGTPEQRNLTLAEFRCKHRRSVGKKSEGAQQWLSQNFGSKWHPSKYFYKNLKNSIKIA